MGSRKISQPQARWGRMHRVCNWVFPGTSEQERGWGSVWGRGWRTLYPQVARGRQHQAAPSGAPAMASSTCLFSAPARPVCHSFLQRGNTTLRVLTSMCIKAMEKNSVNRCAGNQMSYLNK